MKNILLLFSPLFFLFSITTVSAQKPLEFNGKQSTDWNNSKNWKTNRVPTATDHVIIKNGKTCTVNNGVCASLTIEEGDESTRLNINNILTVYGNVDIEGIDDNSSNVIDVMNGTLNVSGDIKLYNTDDNDQTTELRINHGTVNLDGDLLLNSSVNGERCIVDFYGNGTLYIKGTLTGAGDLIEGNGTIHYHNNGNQSVRGTTYNHLIISGSGKKSASGDFSINGILSLNSGELDINGKTITINNNVNRSSGTFTGSANSSLVITGNAGSIDVYMTQTSSQTRSLKDLTVTRSNSINLNDTLELKGHLSLTNNTILNSNGKLYLISNSEGTASVGNLSNATINGDVIAQRFVPGGNAKRRWRLLSSAMNVSNTYSYNQLIDDIHITGPGGSLNGFDDGPNEGSAKIYDESVSGGSANGWVFPQNINANIPIGMGVCVFIRGDRSTPDPFNTNSVPNDAVIDYIGKVNSGEIDVSSLLSYTNTGTPTADGFNLVGNPYPSTIDWESNAIVKSKIGSTIYILNPNSGSYATYNTQTNVGLNGGSRYIASGQGFFVRTTGTNALLKFNEGAKSSANAPVHFRTSNANQIDENAIQNTIRVKVSREEGSTDEMAIVLGDTAHKSAIDEADAVKLFSDNNLNIYSRSPAPELRNLAINYHPIPQESDTIKLSIFSFVGGVKAIGRYYMHFEGLNSLDKNIEIYIKDLYANTYSNVKEVDPLYFEITTDAASTGNERFQLIFNINNDSTSRITNFFAKPNKQYVELGWTSDYEYNVSHYLIEKSIDGILYKPLKPGRVNAVDSSESLNTYTVFDVNPKIGTNYYRLSLVDTNGLINPYKEIIILNYSKYEDGSIFDELETKLHLYPNPFNTELNINLNHSGKEDFDVIIRDLFGRKVFESGYPSTTYFINENLSKLNPGMYIIQVISKNKYILESTKIIKE